MANRVTITQSTTTTVWSTSVLPSTALLAGNNLSELTDRAAAQSNLGLGSAATQPSTAFDAAGDATAAQIAASQHADAVVAAETARATGVEATKAVDVRPAYASKTHGFEPRRSVYNVSASTLAKTRAAIMRASSGGVGNFVWIGDSFSAGNVGDGATTKDPDVATPRQLITSLLARNPSLVDGGGLRPSVTFESGSTVGWSGTGGVTSVNTAYMYTLGAGTITYVSPRAGTSVVVTYANNGKSPITWTIDGVAQANILPNGTTTWGAVRVTGLANTTHTVVLTSGGSPGLFIPAIAVLPATGLRMHNLSLCNSRASGGTNQLNWSYLTASGLGRLGESRLSSLTAYMTAMGESIDTTLFALGTNDITALADPVATAAAIQALAQNSAFAGSEIVLVADWRSTSNSDADWSAFLVQLYGVADALGCALVDLNDYMGGSTSVAQSHGLLGPDNMHGTAGTYAGFGRFLAEVLAA